MKNRNQYKLVQVLGHLPCNIGWNNFDPNVSNGYKFKPGSWRGMYKQLYLVADTKPKDDEYGFVPMKNVCELAQVGKGLTDPKCRKIVMTTNSKLEDVPKFTEEFEKIYCDTHGSIDIIEVDDDFNVLRFKTWWQGEISQWHTYDHSMKATKPKERARKEESNFLNVAKAYDLVKHLYSDTITKMCLDLERQILDMEGFLEETKVSAEEETKIRNTIDNQTELLKGLLKVLVGSFTLGKDDIKLCDKYGIKHNN
jgi:hypothetical protein